MQFKVCPSCNKKNGVNYDFCMACGENLKSVKISIDSENQNDDFKSEKNLDSVIICPKCKSSNKKGAKFCFNCGNVLNIDKVKNNEVKSNFNLNNNFNQNKNNFNYTDKSKKYKHSILSIICALIFIGAGHFYLAQYKRGLIFFIVAAISFLLTGGANPIFVWLLVIVYFYQIYDAYKTTKKVNSGEL